PRNWRPLLLPANGANDRGSDLMTDFAVRAVGLGKRYRLGQVENVFKRMRRRLTNDPGPGHIWAIKDLDFEIEEGDTVAIVGRSGTSRAGDPHRRRGARGRRHGVPKEMPLPHVASGQGRTDVAVRQSQRPDRAPSMPSGDSSGRRAIDGGGCC